MRLTVEGRGEVGEGEEVVELGELGRRADGRHVVRLRYRGRLAAADAIGPGGGGGRGRGRGRGRGGALRVLGRGLVLLRLGEGGGAGDDVQQPANVRHRGLLRRVLLCTEGNPLLGPVSMKGLVIVTLGLGQIGSL